MICFAGVDTALAEDGVFSIFTDNAAWGVSTALPLLLPTGTGVLKLMRVAGAGMDSLESLADDRTGNGVVSFTLSLESLPATRLTGLSLMFLVDAASLLLEFEELVNVRAVGMHATRESLKPSQVLVHAQQAM